MRTCMPFHVSPIDRNLYANTCRGRIQDAAAKEQGEILTRRTPDRRRYPGSTMPMPIDPRDTIIERVDKISVIRGVFARSAAISTLHGTLQRTL